MRRMSPGAAAPPRIHSRHFRPTFESSSKELSPCLAACCCFVSCWVSGRFNNCRCGRILAPAPQRAVHRHRRPATTGSITSARNQQVQTPEHRPPGRRGVSFTQRYCAAPVCNPSRAALMSGLRPSTTRRLRQQHRLAARSSPRQPSRCRSHFRSNGYYVAGAGKIYHDSYRRAQRVGRISEHEKHGDPQPKGEDTTASAASSSPRWTATTRTCRTTRS